MPSLPAKGNLDGTTAGHTTGMFQAAIGDFRDFVAFLLGTAGTKADAQKTLGVAVVDRAYAEQVGYNSLSPNIPIDNTVPQITEGTQIHLITLTPKSASNRFRVRFQTMCSTGYTGAGGLDFATAALFVNGAVSAVASAGCGITTDGSIELLSLEYEWVPGTTAAQTMALRVGCTNGNFIFGGNRFGGVLGGTTRATMVVEEITA